MCISMQDGDMVFRREAVIRRGVPSVGDLRQQFEDKPSEEQGKARD